jgi:signal transduction histidine kinase
LQRLAGNLIENAVRHNVAGGHVRVETRTTGEGATLRVSNDGAVIPPDRVDDLFQPFRRMNERTHPQDGTGLGLAIAKAICEAHDARIDASSQPDGGLAITIVIPPTATSASP